jgi:hypothetical protein
MDRRPGPLSAWQSVAGVMLLGVRVTAHAVLNLAEHGRRAAAGLGAVIDPALLDRLLDLPAAAAVIDPALLDRLLDLPAGAAAVIDPALLDLPAGVPVPAGLADQWPGILARDPDGVSVTRRLESPLSITDVVIQAAARRELRAVQDASLFAGFTRRWVAADRVPDAVLLEAKLCGVGILAAGDQVVLPAAKPAALTRDGWSWLLEEKVYRRWLGERARVRAEVQPLAEPA